MFPRPERCKVFCRSFLWTLVDEKRQKDLLRDIGNVANEPKGTSSSPMPHAQKPSNHRAIEVGYPYVNPSKLLSVLVDATDYYVVKLKVKMFTTWVFAEFVVRSCRERVYF